jgi:hypothetical protein
VTAVILLAAGIVIVAEGSYLEWKDTDTNRFTWQGQRANGEWVNIKKGEREVRALDEVAPAETCDEAVGD